MTVTEDMVNMAFTEYLTAFKVLASKEDELEKMKLELSDYKEGGSKYIEAQNKIREFEHSMIAFQRALREAGMYIDRLKTLLLVEDIAKR